MNPENMLHNTKTNSDFKITSTAISGNEKSPNPTLGTIKMVEDALSEMSEYSSRNKLWRSLPRQVQYPIFKEILKYLEESNKIIFDKDGSIIWVFADNDRIRDLKENSKPLIA